MPPKSKKTKATAEPVVAAVASAPAPVAEPVVPTPVAEPAAPAPAAPAKRSKKPVKVVAVVTPEGIEGTFSAEPRRPLIAHLQIRSSEVQFQERPGFLQYDPNPPGQPEPYNPDAIDMFSLKQEPLEDGNEYTPSVQSAPKASVLEPIITGPNLYRTAVAPEADAETGATGKGDGSNTANAPAATNRPLQCFVRADLMVQYRDMVSAKRIPESTNIACFWCCHQFEGQPCIIPEREVAGVFNVYGNFCCPECAMAYALSENIDPHVRWERIALLHRLYATPGKARITPAPARETLLLFGGPMTIESFRATVAGGKVRVDLHMPPMVSILGSIDTKPIDFFDVGGKLGGGLREAEKIQKAEEGLRLRRTKPLKDRESTLDTVMNIQVRGGGGGGR